MSHVAIANEANLERRYTFTRARDKDGIGSCSTKNVRYAIPVRRTEGLPRILRPQRRQDALIIVTAPSGVLANEHPLWSKVERMFC